MHIHGRHIHKLWLGTSSRKAWVSPRRHRYWPGSAVLGGCGLPCLSLNVSERKRSSSSSLSLSSSSSSSSSGAQTKNSINKIVLLGTTLISYSLLIPSFWTEKEVAGSSISKRTQPFSQVPMEWIKANNLFMYVYAMLYHYNFKYIYTYILRLAAIVSQGHINSWTQQGWYTISLDITSQILTYCICRLFPIPERTCLPTLAQRMTNFWGLNDVVLRASQGVSGEDFPHIKAFMSHMKVWNQMSRVKNPRFIAFYDGG